MLAALRGRLCCGHRALIAPASLLISTLGQPKSLRCSSLCNKSMVRGCSRGCVHQMLCRASLGCSVMRTRFPRDPDRGSLHSAIGPSQQRGSLLMDACQCFIRCHWCIQQTITSLDMISFTDMEHPRGVQPARIACLKQSVALAREYSNNNGNFPLPVSWQHKNDIWS
jgi:hypothetical protein